MCIAFSFGESSSLYTILKIVEHLEQEVYSVLIVSICSISFYRISLSLSHLEITVPVGWALNTNN